MAIGDVELLLLESGGWLVGVDATTVQEVGNDNEDAGMELADILGGRREGTGGWRQRSLRLAGAEGARVRVDATRGTRSCSREDVSPLPSDLRGFGAPDWWLGTLWEDEELVLLIDLIQAVRST